MVKSVSLTKGASAEEALADYFRRAGFFVIRGLPFRHDGEDLTDLDVWLYERGSGLNRRRFIVDSKNRKSPKLVERLLWTAGLRVALGLDGAFVATSGVRDANRRLARRVDVTLIDMQVLGAGAGLEGLRDPHRLSKDEMDTLLADAEARVESKMWRKNKDDVLAAVLTAFGGSGANVALRAARFYAELVLSSAPGSRPREVALRLFFFSSAVAAAGLDFVAAQGAFQSAERRRQVLEDAVRYGTDSGETKAQLDLALQLVRSFLSNGQAAASQLRERIAAESAAVPADIIAEVVLKMAWKGHLFEAARALERAAHLRELDGFGNLDTDARSFTGAVLDFCAIDRVRFAGAWESSSSTAEEKRGAPLGPLFDSAKKPTERVD